MSDRKAAILRWLLIPFAVLGVWLVALKMALLLEMIIHVLAFPFCKEVALESICIEPWFEPLVTCGLYAGIGLAAFLTLVSCVGLAPSHKQAVASATYLAGIAVAVYAAILIGGQVGALSLTSAILVSTVTAAWLYLRHAPATAA